MDVLVSLVLNGIIFLPFLLARVFRHGAAAESAPGEKSLETAAEE